MCELFTSSSTSRKGASASKVDSASDADEDGDTNDDVKAEMVKVKRLCEEGKQSERAVIVEVSSYWLRMLLATVSTLGRILLKFYIERDL